MAFIQVKVLEETTLEGGKKATKGQTLNVGKAKGSDIHPREALRLIEDKKAEAIPLTREALRARTGRAGG